ncbi:efflux transporter outer membrane subunit [Marinobacter salinexigens]|uniref:Efflux transporter outer membrane subunit n=1 Tax=Marinobacter salinexigens TaxID=2919747 RepID=A0A5B0VL00_9GAMM|nr:efflux transporter outer membrane subunit [Marinobacter salinexigens]KAA1175023.1 efflux transporter outer membrane subunit [Marinobacter salinexigens]
MRTVVLAGSLLIAGCAGYQEKAIELPVVAPDQWHVEGVSESSESHAALDPDWWHAFGDPTLVSLIERAVAANPDLKAIAETMIQARLQFRNAEAPRYPSIGAGASVSEQARHSDGASTETDGSTSLSLDMSYELDLWNRLSANEASALAGLEAAGYDFDAARLSLVASVATSWFSLLEARDQLEIAQRNLDIARKTLTLVEVRFRNGVADRSEVFRQKTAVLSLSNQLPGLEYAVSQAEAELNLLTGNLPYGPAFDSGELDSLSIPDISPGSPVDLMTRRPDLAAAEARLKAADADIEAARAALLPSVSISGALQLSADGAFSLADPVSAASALASLSQTLFDGGQRDNAVALTESRKRVLIENYRTGWLEALNEVGDALERVRLYEMQEQRLTTIEIMAEETLRLTEIRYREGADDLLTLLDSQSSLFDARQQRKEARLNRLSAAVDLFKALGGGFSRPESSGDQAT